MNIVKEMFSGVISLFKGLGVTLSYLFKKKETLMYPEERPVLAERFRGIPALPIDPATGKDKCIACSACARVCPDQVITVVAEVGEDKKRKLGDFTLDIAGCIFCGLCVEVCPTGAIVMSDEFELAHATRDDLVIGLDKLHEIGGEFPPAPPPEEVEEPEGGEAGDAKPAAADEPANTEKQPEQTSATEEPQ